MASEATQFFVILERYRRNLTEFKATGSSSLQAPIATDKAWLESYGASLERTSQNQRRFIQKFVAEHRNANPDLIEMQRKLKEIRTAGPRLQDAYETEVKAGIEEPIDFTMHYVKAGLIVGVGALLAVVSAFVPA